MSRLQTVWCGGEPGGSRRQARSSRATCHKACSMIKVGQTRGRPTGAGGSIASIVTARRTSMPCRTISCIAGA
jgi:hypothetical protein